MSAEPPEARPARNPKTAHLSLIGTRMSSISTSNVPIKRIFLCLAVVFTSILCTGCPRSEMDQIETARALEKHDAPPHWAFVESKDEFSGKTSKYAILESANRQKVGLFNDYVHATLVAWDTKNKSDDYMQGFIKFSDNTIPNLRTAYTEHCPYDQCDMEVKFDDGAIRKYEMVSNRDGSAIGYMRSADFFKRAFVAKKIEVRVHFFQRGAGTFVFKNDGVFSFGASRK